MNTLTLWQPWASAMARGFKSVETRSWAAPASMVGQRFAIHASKQWGKGWLRWYDGNKGVDSDLMNLLEQVGAGIEPDAHGSEYARPFARSLPLGKVVASGVLTACVPIIDNCGTDMEAPEHVCISGGSLLHHRPESDPFADGDSDTERGLYRELPWGNYSPGRFAWLFSDVEPTTTRCPWCWGRGRTTRSVPGVPASVCEASSPCPVCWPRKEDGSLLFWDDGSAGKCDPIPARGAQKVWQWEPTTVGSVS